VERGRGDTIIKRRRRKAEERRRYYLEIIRYFEDSGISSIGVEDIREMTLPECDAYLSSVQAMNEKRLKDENDRISKRDKKNLKKAFG
jgi:hypothetical protein